MNRVLEQLKQNKEWLFTKYPIKSLALFGSRSREDYTEDSDVDVLVELTRPDAEAFINLNYELENIVAKKVDLISRGGVKQRFMEYIQKDLQYV